MGRIPQNGRLIFCKNIRHATNLESSEYEEDTPPPPLKPAPCVTQNNASLKKIQFNNNQANSQTQSQQKKLPTILPAFSLPATTQIGNQNSQNKSSIPFPLLILNSLQPQNDKGQNVQQPNNNNNNNVSVQNKREDDFSNILRDLVDVQKESLDVQKQKLEVEKQRLEFDRLIGTQIVTLIPMLGGLLQRLAYPSSQELLDFKLDPETGGKRKRKDADDLDILKDCKILRNMLEQGIKKYMMLDEDKDSDNDDSGIHNDEQSNSSEKSGGDK